MLPRFILAALAAGLVAIPSITEAQQTQHLNQVIDLLIAKKQVIGLQIPSARGGGGGGGGGGGRGRGAGGAGGAGSGAAAGGAVATGGAASVTPPTPPAAPTVTAAPPKTPLDLAKDALAFGKADYLFTSSMEGGVDRGLPAYSTFIAALTEAGSVIKSPVAHLAIPMSAKTPIIHRDSTYVTAISRQLNTGMSIAIFPGVETADELRKGIAALRFKSNGGSRPDSVGTAPAHWGISETEYKQKADIWPLNPRGELMAWAIVESHVGLENVKEIAAVPGLGVLVIGAGTLRQIFTRENNVDGFEPAVQKILAACKSANVPCGYPTNERDIEVRMKEGWSVHVLQSFDSSAFRATDIARRLGGR